MFALRLIQEIRHCKNDQVFEHVEETYNLGDSYSVLRKGQTKDFDKVLNQEKYKEIYKDGVAAIVCGDNGKEFFVNDNSDYTNNSYYIMSESGCTFERL